MTIVSGGSGSGGTSTPAVLSLAYSATIPMTSTSVGYMPQQTVSTDIAFNHGASSVQNSQVYLRLIADGLHTPTFPGFTEWGGSMGYDNTAGIANQIQFFYDGYDYWYSVTQGVAAVPMATGVTMTGPTSGVTAMESTNFTVGVTAVGGGITGTVVVTPAATGGGTFTPTTVSLTTASPTATFTYTPSSTGSKTISVTNNGGLTNPSNITYTSNASATVPGAPTIGTATAGDGTASVTFTAPGSNGGSAITGYTVTASTGQTNTGSASPISVTVVNGVAVTFTVTATNAVGTGAASSASNSVTPAAASYPRLGSLVATTESGAGPYTYAGVGSSLFSTNGGVVTTHLAPGVDGQIDFTLLPGASGLGAGFHTSGTLAGFGSWIYGFYTFAIGDAYHKLAGGGGGMAGGQSRSLGDIVRFARVGNVLKMQLALAATPTVFADMDTYDMGSAPALYIQMDLDAYGTMQLLSSTGFA